MSKRITPSYVNSANLTDSAETLKVFEQAGMTTETAIEIPANTPAKQIRILENCKAIRVFQIKPCTGDIYFAIAEK